MQATAPLLTDQWVNQRIDRETRYLLNRTNCKDPRYQAIVDQLKEQNLTIKAVKSNSTELPKGANATFKIIQPEDSDSGTLHKVITLSTAITHSRGLLRGYLLFELCNLSRWEEFQALKEQPREIQKLEYQSAKLLHDFCHSSPRKLGSADLYRDHIGSIKAWLAHCDQTGHTEATRTLSETKFHSEPTFPPIERPDTGRVSSRGGLSGLFSGTGSFLGSNGSDERHSFSIF